MELPALVLALLATTVALHAGHVAIHVMVSLVWRTHALPSYDAAVGYLGALAWLLLLMADRGTIDPALAVVAVPIGLGLTTAGLIVHFTGVRDLRRHRGDGPLVTEGIYARLRHPIYYGWVLASFGLPLVLTSSVGLLTAPLWSGLIVACGLLEERDLRARLPEGVYDAYASQTWL
jgi:protein-S-isoprenylcysteine O-methyltransferase Ste14